MSKSKRVTIHVLPNKKGGIKDWVIKEAGKKQPIAVFTNKENAIKKAQAIAKKEVLGQLKIHRKDGQIQTEYTYGADPKRYKG